MGGLYTKAGDDGFTTLANGKKVKKSSDIIELCGTLDELGVFLAYSTEYLYQNDDFIDLLKNTYRIQKEIFDISVKLMSGEKFVITPKEISTLEDEIDLMSENLPILQSFILPSGGEGATRLHLARVVCRRAERVAFKFFEKNKNAQILGIYLNRLGDWLYAAARTAALIINAEEILIKDL